MRDINSYANDLLIEFLDAAHDKIRSVLRNEFGDDWFRDGVERHLNTRSLDRTRQMLDSPMAVVDMGKSDDELYGVEHLASIIAGNWSLFEEQFGRRNRTEVYLSEISELRHNVSHRRQHHMLRRAELLRFVRNAQLILAALDSPIGSKFDSVAASLEQGGSPWGNQLGGVLPPQTEIVPEFVGREDEIHRLSIWLTTDDARQLVIWGYGGSGKSALAYQFARAVRDGAPSSFQAVVWLSAKVREFAEGETRDRLADFDSVDSFGSALWAALYDAYPSKEQMTRKAIINELTETPVLLVVDDLDAILDDEDLTHFLLWEIQTSRSRIVYTSRQKIYGLQTVEVQGFSEVELDKFVRSRAREYELDLEECLGRIPAIHSVTDGFPLFVDDLMRHAILIGLNTAIDDWSQRLGDAARTYALRRQLSSLGGVAQRALIAVAVAARPVSNLELASISGFTDDDMQHAIQELLKWRLLSRAETNEAGHPTFSCNRNTQRLVQKTYGRDPSFVSYRETFKALSGSTRPRALRRAVGIAIGNARAFVLRGDVEGAQEALRSAMTGELSDNSDLWGALGWVYSRRQDKESVSKARGAFRRSHELGSKKEDTYYHWLGLEREAAEDMINESRDEDLLEQWRRSSTVAEQGIGRCGDTSTLCNALSYLRTREAKTLERLNHFTAAQSCFRQGVEWARRALTAPNPSSREVHRTQLYRSLVIALEGCGEPEQTIRGLEEWKSAIGSQDLDWRREYDRLRSIPEYRDYLR